MHGVVVTCEQCSDDSSTTQAAAPLAPVSTTDGFREEPLRGRSRVAAAGDRARKLMMPLALVARPREEG